MPQPSSPNIANFSPLPPLPPACAECGIRLIPATRPDNLTTIAIPSRGSDLSPWTASAFAATLGALGIAIAVLGQIGSGLLLLAAAAPTTLWFLRLRRLRGTITVRGKTIHATQHGLFRRRHTIIPPEHPLTAKRWMRSNARSWFGVFAIPHKGKPILLAAALPHESSAAALATFLEACRSHEGEPKPPQKLSEKLGGMAGSMIGRAKA